MKKFYIAIAVLFLLICTGCNYSVEEAPYKVVLDPGHGGKDVGASGVSGQYEKDFTLNVSLKVKERLEQDPEFEVYMTRSDDTYLSQESRYRPKYANEINADIYVSIHGNTFSDSSVSGTETFYYHNNSSTFAKIMHEHVLEATGFKDRKVKKEEFFVLKDTEMPAILLEIGYLTNPTEESTMLSEQFQNQVASAIVEGIKEYRN